MKLLLTGATGFVGQHLVQALLERGHEVVVLVRSAAALSRFPWAQRVSAVELDMHDDQFPEFADLGVDALVHLAWSDLTDYRSRAHLERNLPSSLRLIRHAIDSGVQHVTVTGTCFEYGKVEGCLGEETPPRPELPYAVAKDLLRQQLFDLESELDVTIQWVRLFYMYGEGQNPNSLLAALDRSIDQGTDCFDMSPGDQLRDYLRIEQVAYNLARLIERPDQRGIYNCCSGEPVSVLELVRQRIHEKGSKIELNTGHYGYPKHEPMAFWGDSTKLDNALGRNSSHLHDLDTQP